MSIEAALGVAGRLRETVAPARFHSPSGDTLTVTVCVGVATFPEHGAEAVAILDMADRAMYLGKGSTRNTVHVAAPAPPSSSHTP